MSITRLEYATEVLTGLGIPTGWRHRAAKRALVSWMHAETGEHPGTCTGVQGEGAEWNPLNTTLRSRKSTPYNLVGVQNYPTRSAGIAATVATLQDPRYASVVAELAKPWPLASVKAINAAIGASTWGTPASLLDSAYQAVSKNRGYYNFYSCGPEA